jgi:ferredoxin--NADP+ reductase
LVESLKDDPLIGELVGDKLHYYPTTTREPFHHMGRVTDNLTSGKVFADLGLPAMNRDEDRAMVCGSLAFNVDVKKILEDFGLTEGANSDPQQFVVEKAFVGDGI